MKLDRYISSFTDRVQEPWTVSLLRSSLFAVSSYLVLVLCLPNVKLFWGSHALMPSLGFPETWLYNVIMVMHQNGYENCYPVFFALIGLGLVLYCLKGVKRLATFCIWLGVIVLYNRAYLSMVGGNYLLQSLLFYLIFANEESSSKGYRGLISNLLTNLALWACRIQVLYVYLFSGAYKWASAQWRNGEAVFDILHLKEFSLPWIMESVDAWHGMFIMLNYIAMVYFSVFPFLVWSKKWKVPLLLFGVIWHLGMGWTIGVMDFSIIMIASYAAFLEKDDVINVKRLFTRQIKGVLT